MFENMFEKALKQEERSTMVFYREKKIDRDALCPINVMSFFQMDKHWSYICRSYFVRPFVKQAQ